MRSPRSPFVILIAVVATTLAPIGCAKEKAWHDGETAKEVKTEIPSASMAPSESAQLPLARKNYHDVYADAEAVQSKVKKAPPKATPAIERKIIYTATIQVIVDDLDAAQKKLDALRKSHKAYVANANVSGQTGSQRSGTWTIRLPVEQFEAFRKALLDFGYPQQNSLSSEDITRQYYSLESRMRNAEATEKRLLAHLEKSKETKDTLAIEKELDRVRGTIEEMKGQLQVWQTLTALTTVNLTFIEKKNYQPPQEPTFASRIGDTFSGSVDALASFGRGVTLFLVALVPWLPLLAVIVVPVWWMVRRSRRRIGHKESL
jgi:predicted outer membrane protein